MYRFACVLLALSVSTATVSAQTVVAGNRVRVSTSTGAKHVQVVAVLPDTLVVADTAGAEHRLALAGIRKLEISRGMRTRGQKRQARAWLGGPERRDHRHGGWFCRW